MLSNSQASSAGSLLADDSTIQSLHTQLMRAASFWRDFQCNGSPVAGASRSQVTSVQQRVIFVDQLPEKDSAPINQSGMVPSPDLVGRHPLLPGRTSSGTQCRLCSWGRSATSLSD